MIITCLWTSKLTKYFWTTGYTIKIESKFISPGSKDLIQMELKLECFKLLYWGKQKSVKKNMYIMYVIYQLLFIVMYTL